MSKDRIFNVVTTGVIDPTMQYRPPVQPSSRPLISPEKKIDDFVSDDALESTWESLTPEQQSIVKDVLNKTPGAMDAFEKEDLPMDIIIWAAQNGISGRMGAFPIDGFKRYRSAEERSKKPPTFRGKPWKDVKESLGGMPWPFETQRKQYPKKGEPGLSYFRGEFPNEPNIWVDCLLWRDEKGKLVGILNHYPMDMTLEKKGNVNLFIDPKAKRQGIASALLSEAIKRYNVDLRQQRYSAEGAAFVNEFVRRLPENKEEFGVSGRMAAAISKEKRAEIDEYIKNNRSESDNTIGKKLGVSRAVVQQRRSLLGIPSAYRMKTPPELVSQIEEYIKNNQNEPNSSIAKKFGVSNNIVTNSRVSLGLPSSPLGNLSPELISKIDKRITQNPDHSDNHIARKLGVDKDKVAERRKFLGIPKPKKDTGLLTRLPAEKISAIDAELKRDPDQFTTDIARKLGVSVSNVSARRNVLNLPAALKGRPVISDEKWRQIDEYIKNNPDEANNSIARKFGVSSPTIGTRRRSLGLVAYPTAKKREELVGNLTGPRIIPKETEQKVIRAYLEGEKIPEIVRKFGVSATSIDRILERSGVPRRKTVDKPGEGSSPGVSGRMATRYDKDRYSSEDVRDAILDVYSRGLQVSDALEALRNEYDILMDRTDWTARMTRYRKAGILDSFRLPNKKQTARKIKKSLTQKFIDKRHKEVMRLIKTRPNLTHKEIAEIINRMPIPDGVNVTRMTTANITNILRKGA
jgi:GNAT superfamily N-acetyltransferase